MSVNEVTIPSEIYVKKPGFYIYREALELGLSVVVGKPVAYIGNFKWGPEGELIYGINPGTQDFINQFDPGGLGMDGAALKSTKNLSFPQIYLQRPLFTATASVQFSAALKDNTAMTPIEVAHIYGKYNGTLANNVYGKIVQDGSSDYWYLWLKRGTRTERFRLHEDMKGTGGWYAIESAFCTVKWIAHGANNGRPKDVTSWTLLSAIAGATPGVDGIPDAGDYTGTAGAGDTGIALFETVPGIVGVSVDDCYAGTLQATVMAALKTHTTKGFGRFAHLHGLYDDTDSECLADVVKYQSERCTYTWPFVQQSAADGVSAYETAAPGPISMMLQANLPASTPLGWQGRNMLKLQQHITGLQQSPSDDILTTLSTAGVQYISNVTNGYALGIDRTTSADVNISYQETMATRMFDYIGRWMGTTCEGLETLNAPHTRATCEKERRVLAMKIKDMKEAGADEKRYLTEEMIIDYEMLPYEQFMGNTEESNGANVIGLRVRTAPQHKWTLLRLEIGSTVTITAQNG